MEDAMVGQGETRGSQLESHRVIVEKGRAGLRRETP